MAMKMNKYHSDGSFFTSMVSLAGSMLNKLFGSLFRSNTFDFTLNNRLINIENMNESWHDSCPPVDRRAKNKHVQRSINGYCCDESEMLQFVIENDYQPVKSSDFCIRDEKILHSDGSFFTSMVSLAGSMLNKLFGSLFRSNTFDFTLNNRLFNIENMNESWHDSCPPVDRSAKNVHVQRSINGYCFDESEMLQFVIENDYQPVKSSDFCILGEKILHGVAEAYSMVYAKNEKNNTEHQAMNQQTAESSDFIHWKRPSTSAIKELISNKKHLDVDIYSLQCNKCNDSEPSRNVSDLRINEREHGGNDVDPCEFFICDDRTFLGDGNTKFSKESRDYIPYSSSDEIPYHGNEISEHCSEISNCSSSECSDSDCSITFDNSFSEGSSICVEFDVSLHQNEDVCLSPYEQLTKSKNPYVSYILGDNSCDDDSDMSSDDESDTGCYAESEHLNLPVGGLMFDFCDDLSVENLANHVSEDISDDINDVKLVKHPITDEVDCANKEESDKCYETFVNTSQYTNNHHDSPESIDSLFHNSKFNGLCDPDIDVEQAVKDANNRWKVSMENQSAVGTCRSQKKVRFLDNNESSISEVYFVPQEDRKGLWEIEALNRCRFRRRIQDLEPVLNPILSASHRTNIYEKIYCDASTTGY